MTSITGTIILHVDMDAFFASVEQRDNPKLKGKPVIVGALPGTRGVVSAASYEARKFGVRSAMPVAVASRLCPLGIFVEPRFEAYSDASKRVMSILRDFSPRVEQVSMDEAYLDITGTGKLLGTPQDVGRAIKSRVLGETKLTISVGIAPNKFLAKLASDMNKPDGLTMTPFGRPEIIAWLAPMPVGRLFGVGKVTEELFFKQGIKTIGDVQKLTQDFLVARFGKNGRSLYDLCRGVYESPVREVEESKSISREHTFQADTADLEALNSTLLSLSRDVARRARRDGRRGSTVVLIYRGKDFTKHTRRTALAAPADISRTIYETVTGLFKASPIYGFPVRLIGVGLTGFDDVEQTSLFEADSKKPCLLASEKAIDEIVSRFGEKAIFVGSEVMNRIDRLKRIAER
jgi:DNA polymerase IV